MREYFKKRYEFRCAKCNKVQWAKPSMSMTEFGRNSGHGRCTYCDTFLHLEIEGDLCGETMVSIIWEDFLKTIKIERPTQSSSIKKKVNK